MLTVKNLPVTPTKQSAPSLVNKPLRKMIPSPIKPFPLLPSLSAKPGPIITPNAFSTPDSSGAADAQRRRILIDPGFSLFRDGKPLASPSTEEFQKLMSIFPHCYAVDHSPPFLVLRFTVLTPKPWPLKIAGLVPWFTIDAHDLPPGALDPMDGVRLWSCRRNSFLGRRRRQSHYS